MKFPSKSTLQKLTEIENTKPKINVEQKQNKKRKPRKSKYPHQKNTVRGIAINYFKIHCRVIPIATI